jgi:TolB-like protein/DNA-binding winged helix-turn-helix (wHTH) protein/Tfp pilus assembly protein PilF
MSDRTYRFAEFELIESEGELRNGGSSVRLQQKPLLLLNALLDQPQRVVTREQLRERMWGNETFVDYEQGINVAIKKVRDALGDSADEPKYIQTVSKKGYKFLLPVEVVEPKNHVLTATPEAEITPRMDDVGVSSGRAAGTWDGWIPRTAGILLLVAMGASLVYMRGPRSAGGQVKAIAVLPLQNLSADPEQEYFAEGMTDELITDLAKIHPLRVISRTSVMRYKRTLKPIPEIAHDLNVDAVVEGTISRSAERVQIRVQLIDAQTDSHLWAETYERDQRDALSLQNEVASAIARHINLELTPQRQTSLSSAGEPSFEAYSAYLKGRYEWNKRTPESLWKSIEYFEAAIKEDPNYALAHEGLAETYSVLSDYDVLTPKESYSKAKAEALRALELDDSLGPAHATLATVKEELEWDWPGADREFRRAIQLSPSYATAHQWYGEYLMRVGRVQEGLAEMQQAAELDPGSPLMNAELGGALYWARRYDNSIHQLQMAIAMEPGFAYTHSWLGFAYEQEGMQKQAVEEFQKAVDLSGGSATFIAALGHGYGLMGNVEEGRRIAEKLKALSKHSYISPYDMAIIYAGIGEKDEALHWLEVGYTVRDPALDMLKVEPALDTLRSDNRFQELVHRVGLPAS